jgi:hypothetical protein
VRLSALLGGATGLALLTKPQAIALVPGSAAVLAIAVWPTLRERATWRRIGVALVAFAALAVPAAIALRRSVRAFRELNAAQLQAAAAVHESFPVWLAHAGALRSRVFRGFWGTLGWGEFGVDHVWTDLVYDATLVGAGALVAAILLRLGNLDRRWWSWRGLGLCVATVVLTGGFVYYAEYHARASVGVGGVIQGRNFLYGLPALAILAVIALGALLPTRLRRAAAATLVTGAAALQLAALATVIRYYDGH